MAVCKTYSYCMIEVAPDYLNTLWTSAGQIKYQSAGHTTDWHGSFTKTPLFPRGSCNMIELKFHYLGKLKKLRTTTVVEISPGVYQGRDYKSRLIEMRELDTFYWNPSETSSEADDGEWCPVLALE